MNKDNIKLQILRGEKIDEEQEVYQNTEYEFVCNTLKASKGTYNNPCNGLFFIADLTVDYTLLKSQYEAGYLKVSNIPVSQVYCNEAGEKLDCETLFKYDKIC
jgi:hypothetical protein